MAITAKLVKQLRDMTGAGMMDCKKALVETDGNIEKAVDVLREKGLAKAAKRSDKVAAEGLVREAFSDDHKKAVLIEVNSETDFVAKSPDFIEFVESIADVTLKSESKTLDELMKVKMDGEKSVEDVLNDKKSKIGENISIRRFEFMEAENTVYTGYIHGGGSIGVIIGMETSASKDEIEKTAKDVAMQVASMNPKFMKEDEVDAKWLESEKEIAKQQLLNEGKKPELIEKIVPGKIKKVLNEVCLVDQKFVKDSDVTVAQYIKNSAKELGKDMKLASMLRYEVGEGIEKQEENFADEVAKQMK